MTNLSKAQTDLLTAASAAEDGAEEAQGDPKTIAALIKKGFLISVPQAEGPSQLLITTAGREAIELEAKAPEPAEEAAAPAPAQESPAPTTDAKPKRRKGEAMSVTITPATPASARKPAGKAKTKDKAPASDPKAPAKPKGKIASLVELLSGPDGTTVEAMMAVTGWQAHSVRGAMSGAIKKGMGLVITSDKTAAGRIYRIQTGAGA